MSLCWVSGSNIVHCNSIIGKETRENVAGEQVTAPILPYNEVFLSRLFLVVERHLVSML